MRERVDPTVVVNHAWKKPLVEQARSIIMVQNLEVHQNVISLVVVVFVRRQIVIIILVIMCWI